MKKLLAVILAMIMFVGAFSVSAVSQTPEEEWELIYDYYYNYGKKDFYSVKIYRNETVSGVLRKTFSTKYKFVAYSNKNLVNGVEYITQEAYKWSPGLVKNNKLGYSKSLYVDYDKYLKDKTYRNYVTGEILQIAVTKDKYLHMYYMNKIQSIIKSKDKTLTDLCYNCFEACKTKKVCRYCNGDLINSSSGKAVCQDCKKSQYLSLAKTVCSVCKNENITSIKSLWSNIIYYSLSYVQKNFPNRVDYDSNVNKYEDDKIFMLLKYNWDNSDDEVIKKAREIQPDWKTSSQLYDKLNGLGRNSKEINLFSAVYLNRANSYTEFSKSKTDYLINKYIQMAKNYYNGKIQESVLGVLGELCPNKLGILEKVTPVFINLMDKEHNKQDETTDNYAEDDQETAEEESLGKQFLYSLAEEYGDDFKDDFVKEIESGMSEVLEVTELCFDVTKDLKDYYDSSFGILMGKSIAKECKISDLCDDIALAAMSQHIQDNYVKKDYVLNGKKN